MGEFVLPKRLNRKTIYESDWINLYIDKMEMPSGDIIEKYHQLDYPKESVSVLCINQNQEICLVRSLRYTTNQIEWEVPAGSIDNNETPIDSAIREFKEETGYDLVTPQIIHSYHSSNGMSNELIHIVSGQIKSLHQSDYQTDEISSVHWLNSKKVSKMILNKQITDGISLMPLLFLFSGYIEL